MGIKAITFDWGDTLAANYSMPYSVSQKRAFAGLAQQLQVSNFTIDSTWQDDSRRQLREAFEFSIDVQRNPQHQELDFSALLSGWLANAGAENWHGSSYDTAMEAFLIELTDVVVPFANAASTLKQLKQAGYRIGILSHVAWPSAACHAWFSRHGFASAIDFYSLSCDIGWIKPNQRHY
ncbi:MAG: HAD family hydrolase, partial [Planctomycetes bacterium]|nr:HAD family hydrolase [Planctomycetota bacterium]